MGFSGIRYFIDLIVVLEQVTQPIGMAKQKRHGRHDYVGLEEECRSDVKRGHVVQEMLPPALGHDLRYDYGHKLARQNQAEAVDVFHQRAKNRPIGRRNNDKRNSDVPLLPVRRQLFGCTLVDLDVRRHNLVRYRTRVHECRGSCFGNPVDWHDDGMMRRHDRTLTLELDLGRELHVMAMNLPQQHDYERDDQTHDPRAFDELRHDLKNRDNSRGDRSQPVQRRLPLPSGLSGSQPMHYHAGLRQRKADEDTHRVQRNECIRLPTEYPDYHPRYQAEGDDAVRERESVSARRELSRHVSIVRQNSRQSWKVRERGIRGEYENSECCVLKDVVKTASPEDVTCQLR